MIKIWHDTAWDDYLYRQTQDRKTLKRINKLLQDIDRNGYNGIGKPEPLKGDLSGFWSIQIDEKNRIVFRIENSKLEITQCGSHYRDK
jgi:toxin YoeB